MSRRLAAFALLTAATIGLSSQAYAHAHLKAAVPADNAVVAASPTALTLSFTEALNLKFSGIKLIDAKGAEIKVDGASLTNDGTGLSIPVKDKLAAGSYKVEWHALSTDGHKTNGSYSFTIKP